MSLVDRERRREKFGAAAHRLLPEGGQNAEFTRVRGLNSRRQQRTRVPFIGTKANEKRTETPFHTSMRLSPPVERDGRNSAGSAGCPWQRKLDLASSFPGSLLVGPPSLQLEK
ncbi:hypothetical protein MRX96_044243 [Rhipicephalus microplus]